MAWVKRGSITVYGERPNLNRRSLTNVLLEKKRYKPQPNIRIGQFARFIVEHALWT